MTELCQSNLSGIVGKLVSELMTRESFSSDKWESGVCYNMVSKF
jgi:hypothetical protein